ncbi:MAG: hypothetical protein AB8B65_19580 [Kordia sp.]|uniref:hypothetical protein n=1 Tax=Kordia sp. TaxID=1965332 RepID=UPI00385CB955
MIKKNCIRLLIFFITLQGYSQASWSYAVWFNILDETGKTLTEETYSEKELYIATHPFGAYKDNKLEYDSTTKMFKFSQSTITTESVLLFVHNSDTTKVHIGTENMYIKDIELTGKTYSILRWNNEANFVSNQKVPALGHFKVCIPKFPFEQYEIGVGNPYYERMTNLSKKTFEIVPPIDENGDDIFLHDINYLESKNKLTHTLRELYTSNVKAIYPVGADNYLVFKEYSSGNGNHYYDNISITLVAIGEYKITYFPLELEEKVETHVIDDHGNLIFTQHQGISDFAPMDVYFDQKTKTIRYQYQYFKSIGDSDKTMTVKGAYILKNNKLIKTKK